MANAYVTLGQGAAANNNLISGFRNGIYAINNTHKDIECIGALNATYLKTNKLGPAGFGLFCAAGATMPD